MSQQNVELHRCAVAAINAHDPEAFIALSDPDVEGHSAMTTPGGAVYHGHDGVRRWFRDLEDVWGDAFRVEAEAYFDLGEQTLMFNVLRGRGRQSGAEVAAPWAVLTRWRAGRAVYWRTYTHREDALRDLGRSVDDLEPIAP